MGVLLMMSIDDQKNCSRCDLRAGCSQVVLPDADADRFCGLFAVGEAPGKDEDEKGLGFVGSAGKKLDWVLANAHGAFPVSREQYGRANIACCRPPENRKPKKSEILACSPWLEEAMVNRFNVRVILAVGGTPASYFYSGSSLWSIIERAEKNGFSPDCQWAKEAGLLVVPMPHTSPLAWNRNAPSGEKWSEVGLRQAKKAISICF